MQLRRVLRFRAALTVAATAGMVVPLIAVTTPAASAACASRTTRSVSGLVYGVDNQDVNVSIGYDVESSTGAIINVSDGCAKTGGYSAPVQEKNHFVGYQGQPRGSMQYDAQGRARGATTRTWSLGGLPSNAKYVWIEVYSRSYNGSPCPTCMGPVDTRKYGFSTRRRVPVGATNALIRLPINCGYAGGANGAINGTIRNGALQPVTAYRVYAWSIAPDSNYKVLGWGSGAIGAGTYNLSAMAPNQSYTIWVYYNGRVWKKTNVAVAACRSTRVDWILK